MKSDYNNEQVAQIERYLRKIDYIIRKEGRGIIKDFNITIPQFTALQILIKNENMTIGELSQHMSLACSTITDLIDRMEKSELVNRKKDDKDKRVVRIEVQQKGYDILEKVLQRRREYLESKLNDFTIDDKERLTKVLGSLYEAMKQDSN